MTPKSFLSPLAIVVLLTSIVDNVLANEEPPSIAATVDLIDLTEYSAVPLDDAWYDRVFADCNRHGLTRIYWRVALGRAYYRSRIMARITREGNDEPRIQRMADLLSDAGPEPLELAVKYAHQHGVELYAWFPFNETHYCKAGVRDLVDPWYAHRRDLYWCNRDGSRVWMGMPCVAEPEVVERTVSIIHELCGYGVDGVFLTPRSHCYRPSVGDRISIPTQIDEFGYNEPIRRRFRERYKVDICRDAFDYDAWHRIKGEFYTEFLAACAAAAHKHHCRLEAGTSARRLAYIPNLDHGDPTAIALRIVNDWKSWHQMAGVDGIVAIQSRLRLPAEMQSVPLERVAETVSDVSAITSAAPGCPVALFSPVLAFRPGRGGSWSLRNRLLEPPEVLEFRRKTAREQGAATLILHEGYIPLFVDSQGKETGVGPCPQPVYWDAVRRWSAGKPLEPP